MFDIQTYLQLKGELEVKDRPESTKQVDAEGLPESIHGVEVESHCESTEQVEVESHPETPPLLPQPSRLEILPAELRSQVLSSLTSPDDLWATIHASPVLYQQYRADRKNILRHVMRNTLGDRVLVDAYAVLKTSPLERPPDLVVDLAVRQFIETYQNQSSQSLSMSSKYTMADLLSMAAFYSSTIGPLMEKIPEKLLHDLNSSLQLGHLTAVERTRIIRALYRFQLWCNLYGDRDGAVPGDEPDDGLDMLVDFFEVFEPWEVEELSCIHLFFVHMYGWVIVDLRCLHGYGDPWPPHSSWVPVDGTLLLLRDRTTPQPADHTARVSEYRNERLNGLVSRGLGFHLAVMERNITEHHEELHGMIQPPAENAAYVNFISDALSLATQKRRLRDMGPPRRDEAQTRGDPMPFRGDDEDAPSAAWAVMWKGRYSNKFGQRLPLRLKTWGYVFWDERRLDESRGRKAVLRAMQRHLWPTFPR
ncbi:hypothetical protein C8A01DRAFT_20840 [Parachaetomium inaequale]|uniref:Uncharacterized protein n=1 Tax=Parachaetomium inaequale TaxID=2588326 RepID=A0AAN6P927_9PEZI|nr:hypothetical protein C8A01DRAFT_20840 [Parachaetomium inaequale]